MAFLTYIDDILIDDDYILKYPDSTEELCWEGDFLIPDDITEKLSIIDGVHDPRNEDSIFYNGGKIGTDFRLHDTEIKRNIFKGKVDNFEINDGSKELEISITTIINDLNNIPCNYDNSASPEPFAQAIYNLLINHGVPAEDIVYAGFQKAIVAQTAAGANVIVTYAVPEEGSTDSNDTPVGIVITELLRMSNCHIYTHQSLIHMYQYDDYDGEIGTILTDNEIISGSIRLSFSHGEPYPMYNSYAVAYKNGIDIAYTVDQDNNTIEEWGEKKFLVPNEDVDSTSEADYNVLCATQTCAEWVGTTTINRFKNLALQIEFKIGIEWNHLRLGSIINLQFDEWINEPVILIYKEPDLEDRAILCRFIFANRPVELYERDITPPLPPYIAAAIPVEGGIFLKWSRDEAIDHLGYKLYFTTSPGEWFSELCHMGQSPVDRKNIDMTDDGFIFQVLLQLNSTRYFFKARAYDTSYNQSDNSNVIYAIPGIGTPNMYRCQGDIYSGVSLDNNNLRSGTVPSGFDRFSDGYHYGSRKFQPPAIYESFIFYNPDGFSFITWKTFSTHKMICQFRTSADGVTFTAWSEEIDANTVSIYSLSCIWFQFRFIFYSRSWNDTDYFIIKNVA